MSVDHTKNYKGAQQEETNNVQEISVNIKCSRKFVIQIDEQVLKQTPTMITEALEYVNRLTPRVDMPFDSFELMMR